MSLVLALAVGGLLGQTGPGAPRPGRLDGTPHNLFGPGGHATSPELDLCQLCHVPNRLRSARLRPPLWSPLVTGRNAALDAPADPAGPPLALRWAGSTLRCLSCHDATISSLGITFRPASGSLRDDAVAGDPARASGTHGPSLLAPQAWMGDVMANHPVSVPYPLGGRHSEFRDFTARATTIEPADWVEDPRTKGVKLLADSSGFDLLSGTAGVECVSCHDPHGTANSYFLRLPKERSELCLACHRK
jgi:predicted CXXCH cytochrome family protein